MRRAVLLCVAYSPGGTDTPSAVAKPVSSKVSNVSTRMPRVSAARGLSPTSQTVRRLLSGVRRTGAWGWPQGLRRLSGDVDVDFTPVGVGEHMAPTLQRRNHTAQIGRASRREEAG